MNTIDAIELLKKRYAVKKFDTSKKLSEEHLSFLEEVLRLTPSSFGFEPWKFVIVSDPDIRAKLMPYSYSNKQVVEASHLIVLCAKKHMQLSDVRAFLDRTVRYRSIPDSVRSQLQKSLSQVVLVSRLNGLLFGIPGLILGTRLFSEWTTKQVYVALGNLLTSCAHHGIDAAPMEGFSQRGYEYVLKEYISGYSPVVLCAVGYRASDDPFATMAKVRKEIEEIIVRV